MVSAFIPLTVSTTIDLNDEDSDAQIFTTKSMAIQDTDGKSATSFELFPSERVQPWCHLPLIKQNRQISNDNMTIPAISGPKTTTFGLIASIVEPRWPVSY